MKIRVTLLIIGAMLPSLSNAGWFGPSNYDECVLDQMKDQAKNMIYHARNYCESKFPYEKKLVNYLSQIEHSWWTKGEKVFLSIKNPGTYRITHISVNIYQTTHPLNPYFQSDNCEHISRSSSQRVVFRFTPNQTTSFSSVPYADNYKCMDSLEIWGILDPSHTQAYNDAEFFIGRKSRLVAQ